MPLILPPIKVQHQIIERLDAIRKLQELNQREIEKAEELFNSLLSSLLKPKLGWQTKKLGEVAEIGGGGTPPTSHAEYFGGDIPWFTPSEIKSGTVNLLDSSLKRITEKALRFTKVVERGSVLLSSRATIGNVGIVLNCSTYNQGIKGITPRKELNPWYLAYWLLASKKKLEKLSHGTTFKELSSVALKGFDISIPSLNIQHQIVERLDAIRKLQELKKKEKEKLLEFFESTLNKLMKPN